MGIGPSDILLADRLAVVTGGEAAIGRGIAASLVAFGASVAIWERDADSCAAASRTKNWWRQQVSASPLKSSLRPVICRIFSVWLSAAICSG
jgi:NAD(P)-dependent dehydrogenase (short-subunit alcohol dehydrogenase family)